MIKEQRERGLTPVDPGAERPEVGVTVIREFLGQGMRQIIDDTAVGQRRRDLEDSREDRAAKFGS